MNTFQFRLQKALDWRRTQLELAEAQFRGQIAALARLDGARAELEAQGIRAEVEVRDWPGVAGQDLAALGAYRLRVRKQEQEIDAQREQCRQELAIRRKNMLESRRLCRLLERLKERRFAEWQATVNRQMEENASEGFLAQWNRHPS